MGVNYQPVLWNRQKRVYDLTLLAGVLIYLGLFIGVSATLRPNATIETLIIRGFGTLAFLLLHVILVIGPLARLNSRFLPLLYNRRHLGVTMFLCGLVHAAFSTLQFHMFGDLNPLASLLVSNPRFESLSQFPFQLLGLGALGILFLMAATSHDFWLANLSAPVWKTLHMLVYLAYGLLVLHVALGILQAETQPIYSWILGLGFAVVMGLHLFAGFRESLFESFEEKADKDGFVEACRVDDIPESRARIVTLSGERVAIFKHENEVSAVSNVCQHQNGPLGEGRIVNGCITCPWHGYQYLAKNGQSPPPFTEKIPTFNVRVNKGVIWVHPKPNPAGTEITPARVGAS